MLKSLGTALLALAWCVAGPALAEIGGSGDQVLARSGAYAYGGANFATVLALYEAVLESPLGPGERARLQAIGVAEFNARPREVSDGYPKIRQLLDILKSGTEVRRAALRELIWEHLIQSERTDPFSAQTLDLMRHHVRIVAEGGGMVVTEPELDALFAAEDDVAHLGGLARQGGAQRSALRAEIAGRFAALPKAEQEKYAHAETRRALLLGRLAGSPAARARLGAEIRQAVHSPSDLDREVAALEDRAVQLQIAENRQHGNGLTASEQAQLAAFQARMHAGNMALMGFQVDSAGLQGVDRAVTQFNSRTYTAPHNAH